MIENFYPGATSQDTQNGFARVYKGTTGTEIKLPVSGNVYSKQSENDMVFIDYIASSNCTFTLKIDNIAFANNIFGQKDEGFVIGTSNKEEISLLIDLGHQAYKIDDFFSKKGNCFKSEESKSQTNNTNKSEVTKSNATYNPYRIAALPFDVAQGGISAAKKIIGVAKEQYDNNDLKIIIEEVERIKQLMK